MGAPPSTGGSSSPVTITVDCAPPAARPVQHKEWLEDVATFEKANPNITIKGVDNYPCENTATFTAMLEAGPRPNLFHTYFTDLTRSSTPARPRTSRRTSNSTTVPRLSDIVPGAMDGGHGRHDDLRPADRQLHPGPDLQPEAVPAGRPEPGPAADHLGAGRDGRHRDPELGNGIEG